MSSEDLKNTTGLSHGFLTLVSYAGVIPMDVIRWDRVAGKSVVEHTHTTIGDVPLRAALALFSQYFELDGIRLLAKGYNTSPDVGHVASARVALVDVATRLKASGIEDYSAEVELILKRFDAYQSDKAPARTGDATAAAAAN